MSSAEQLEGTPALHERGGPRAMHGRLLMVAYHFPPIAASSGFLRSLKFCRYLPEFGWLPTVLTVNSRAYEQVDCSQLGEIPPEVKVVRAFAFDTRRHLSIGGRYLKQLALPDRWVTWLLGAIPAGLTEIRKSSIDAIFTTFPIASAVLIGYILHQLTGKPWIVDFRDSMTEGEYPFDRSTRRLYRWIERKAIKHGSLFLFTARSTLRMYLDRYPKLNPEACLLLPNGYDEADFVGISVQHTKPGTKLRILHSGLVYPWERDPTNLFAALARLKEEGKISSANLEVELRASGLGEEYQRRIEDLGIADIVRFSPALPYAASLRDAAEADALLLIQGAVCNHQVPAKVYEYLRLRKPILALTDPAGDTGALLSETGGATIAANEDADQVCLALSDFIEQIRAGSQPLPSPQICAQYSRRSQAKQFARSLSSIWQIAPPGNG